LNGQKGENQGGGGGGGLNKRKTTTEREKIFAYVQKTEGKMIFRR